MLENIPIELKISRDQKDWLNSLEEKLTQVQEDLSFYNDILEEFTAEDIISLGLDSRNDITQKSSVVMIIVDAAATADITADTVILNDANVANDSCA